MQQLPRLLDDPDTRRWLERVRPEALAAPAVPTRADPAPRGEATVAAGAAVQGLVVRRLDRLRRHFAELGAAAPRLPVALARAGATLVRDLEGRGVLELALLVPAFAALGFGAQRLAYRLSGGWRRRIVAAELATVPERLRVVGERLAASLMFVAAFASGSLGAFLLFDWPPALERVVTAGLIVFLGWRVTVSVGRVVVAPGDPRFRILPMSQPAAEHWFRWSQIAGAWFGFGYMLLGVLRVLGVTPAVTLAIAYVLGLVLLGIGIGLVMVWRRPAMRASEPGARVTTVLISVWLGSLWLARFAGANPFFWLLAVAVALPAAVAASRRAVNHLLRPPAHEADGEPPPDLVATALERGLRVALVLVALWLLARAFGLDVERVSTGENVAARLLRGAFDAIVILIIADFVWALARTWIDGKLAAAGPGPSVLPGEGEGGASAPADLDPAAARRDARLRTLLPILRNVGFVVLAVMTALMALSALSVEVGPLLASAGVVGVAVGFGAQTIVKDVISGLFYLLDDAFRVGEYIQSGSYKGTVEAFSLRSVKLRHHRGPLFTVPFGESPRHPPRRSSAASRTA